MHVHSGCFEAHSKHSASLSARQPPPPHIHIRNASIRMKYWKLAAHAIAINLSIFCVVRARSSPVRGRRFFEMRWIFFSVSNWMHLYLRTIVRTAFYCFNYVYVARG